MATYHCSVKVGCKGKASAHAAYIGREGRYASLEGHHQERAVSGSDVRATSHAEYIARTGPHQAKGGVEYSEHGNMPAWAKDNPQRFWQASDAFERKNGSTYREIEVALPRELNPEARRELVQGFVREQLGDRHAYSFAIHNPRAAIEGGEQPHAHIMYSERVQDGIARDPGEYFKRYNAKHPERGGCRKDGFGGDRARLVELRQRWAEHTNRALERQGEFARVDHRSLKDQGVKRAPEKHLGPVEVRRESNVVLLAEYRAAKREREAAWDGINRIDVKTSLGQVLREVIESGRMGRPGPPRREAPQPAQGREAPSAKPAGQIEIGRSFREELAAREAERKVGGRERGKEDDRERESKEREQRGRDDLDRGR